jgi:hypothetical protein
VSNTAKIATLLAQFRAQISAHDRHNPPPHGAAWGIGLSQFDMERLGFDEGETLWEGVIVSCDGGPPESARVLCDGEHSGQQMAAKEHALA